MADAWEQLGSEPAFDDPHFHVRRDTVRLPSGRIVDDYLVGVLEDYALVIAVTDGGEVVLPRQWKQGVRRVTLELPGGKLDAGETADQAGVSELREETGYAAVTLELLASLDVDPSKAANHGHVFLGLGAERLHDPEPDEMEAPDVVLVPVAELPRLIAAARSARRRRSQGCCSRPGACSSREAARRRSPACDVSLEHLVEDRRRARPPVRVQRVAGDHADGRPSESRVEPLGAVAGDGVEHEQRPALGSRLGLGTLHQALRDAAPARRPGTRSFAISARCGWFGGNARITCTVPTRSLALEGGQQEPAPLLDLGGERFEHTARVLVRERRQIADGCPSGDAVLQDARERIELLVGVRRRQAADLECVGGHRHIVRSPAARVCDPERVRGVGSSRQARSTTTRMRSERTCESFET